MKFVDLQAQYRQYKEEIDRAIQEVLDSTNFIMGPQVKFFEEKLAAYVGVKYCVGAASGTDTLLMALMAWGVGAGDEVITVPFTFIATSDAIALLGAKPVFIDIDPKTYNMDVSKLESAITPRTKAIIPVSLFGQMANYKAINAIADKYGIPVMEDGAQSLGATQWGRQSCGVTRVGSTSFFPSKTFGCYGDGGALFTNDDRLADKLYAIRTHGSRVRDHYPLLGITGRLDTIQAAIMLAKLPHFPDEVKKRQQIAKRYDSALKEICQIPAVEEGNTHAYSLYTIRVDYREEVKRYLNDQGVPAVVYYPKCLHEQPVFDYLGYQQGSLPEAEKAAREVLSLPIHPWLTEDQQSNVIEALTTIIQTPPPHGSKETLCLKVGKAEKGAIA